MNVRLETFPEAPFGRETIETLVPHRSPFLYLDRVLRATPQEVAAEIRFGSDEPCFRGHFPGDPTVPGVLLVEAMAQASLVLYRANLPGSTGLLYLSKADARFYAPGRPDRIFTLLARRIKVIEGGGLVEAEVADGTIRLAKAKLAFAGTGLLEGLAPPG